MAIFIIDDTRLGTLLQDVFRGAEREAMLAYVAGAKGDWLVFSTVDEVQEACAAADSVEFVGYTLVLQVGEDRMRRFVPEDLARQMEQRRNASET